MTLSQQRLLCSGSSLPSSSLPQDLDLLLCLIHSSVKEAGTHQLYTYPCLAYLLTSAEWHPGFEDNYGTLDDGIVDDLLRFVCGIISGASG